jgi:hypothetical protein
LQGIGKISAEMKEKQAKSSKNLFKLCNDLRKITIFAAVSGRNPEPMMH